MSSNSYRLTTQVNRLAQAVTELAREVSDVREENRKLVEALKIVRETLSMSHRARPSSSDHKIQAAGTTATEGEAGQG